MYFSQVPHDVSCHTLPMAADASLETELDTSAGIVDGNISLAAFSRSKFEHLPHLSVAFPVLFYKHMLFFSVCP